MNEKEVRQQIAYDIRSELVCCMVYHDPKILNLRKAIDETEDSLTEIEYVKQIDEIISGHDICYWGEAAALISEEGIIEE